MTPAWGSPRPSVGYSPQWDPNRKAATCGNAFRRSLLVRHHRRVDAHFAASVIDREVFDPTGQWPALWEAHAR